MLTTGATPAMLLTARAPTMVALRATILVPPVLTSAATLILAVMAATGTRAVTTMFAIRTVVEQETLAVSAEAALTRPTTRLSTTRLMLRRKLQKTSSPLSLRKKRLLSWNRLLRSPSLKRL